jgi:D-alanine-D-alanine ligase
LLFGGRSAEHEVSCISAVAIIDALEGAGHTVVPVGIDRSGAWRKGDAAQRPLRAEGGEVSLGIPSGTIRADGVEVDFDVVFPVLHGPFGEDGTIQGALEIAGVPYVGSGVLGSAIGMEKDIAKRLFVAAGLPTVRYEVARHAEWDDDPAALIRRFARRIGYPAFVKPVALGSSVGVTRVDSEDIVKLALANAFGHGDKIIVEEAVNAREIEVAVLDGPRVSVPGEILITADWYTYEAKYQDAASVFDTPARLTESQTAEVRRMAADAFEALQLRGPTRVDFFFEEEGRGFLINEVNTMPGFTPGSGFPLMWQASGMSYPALCDELIKLALG